MQLIKKVCLIDTEKIQKVESTIFLDWLTAMASLNDIFLNNHSLLKGWESSIRLLIMEMVLFEVWANSYFMALTCFFFAGVLCFTLNDHIGLLKASFLGQWRWDLFYPNLQCLSQWKTSNVHLNDNDISKLQNLIFNPFSLDEHGKSY